MRWLYATRWVTGRSVRHPLLALLLVAGGLAFLKDACETPAVCQEHPHLDACGG